MTLYQVNIKLLTGVFHTIIHLGYPTICDLRPEDKKRVRELIEQVARLGSEKENLLGEMAKERDAYRGLLEALKTQCHEMSENKSNILS